MALTKHSPGSLRELWKLSFPLMLTQLSVMMMTFTDRWLLANFSVDAHNAAVAATTLGWALICGWIVLAGIAEVFVAQYNGAGQKHRLGEPVWQMLWFSLFSVLFFLPAAHFITLWTYGTGPDTVLERDYLGIMLLFGPFYAAQAALCGFFVGQGKTRLITSVVVVANVLNMFLDWVMIFGVEGWVPQMGVKGAAIATSMAVIFQMFVLGAVFLNKKNREEYGTGRWKLDIGAAWACAKIGLPSAVLIVMDILAFAFYYHLMKGKGLEYITIAGICQTMFILCIFFSEGVNKAVTAIVGNMIGAKEYDRIPRVFWSGFLLNIFFFAGLFTLFWLGTPFIVSQFLPLADPVFVESIYASLQTCLLLTTVLIFFEGMRLIFSGGLTAAGDTMFLLLSGSSLVWLTMVLPVYLIVILNDAPIEVASLISVGWCVTAASIYFLRTRMIDWRSGDVEYRPELT